MSSKWDHEYSPKNGGKRPGFGDDRGHFQRTVTVVLTEWMKRNNFKYRVCKKIPRSYEFDSRALKSTRRDEVITVRHVSEINFYISANLQINARMK